jgi:hypothetical protein
MNMLGKTTITNPAITIIKIVYGSPEDEEVDGSDDRSTVFKIKPAIAIITRNPASIKRYIFSIVFSQLKFSTLL